MFKKTYIGVYVCVGFEKFENRFESFEKFERFEKF